MLGLRTIFKRLQAKLRRQATKRDMRRSIESWEDFDEAAMRELLDDITQDAERQLDELSDSFHSQN